MLGTGLPGLGLNYTGTPLQYSCLENPMDGGAWKAAVHGVATTVPRQTLRSSDAPSSYLLVLKDPEGV